jgi:hypothetical protein
MFFIENKNFLLENSKKKEKENSNKKNPSNIS